MTGWIVHHDLRTPPFGAPREAIYAEALAMTTWVESRGCPRVAISEHHGSPDGYLPSPVVFAAAVAARTERIRILISALVLTLRDPVSTAEDVAVCDILSGGRLEVTVVPGYVAEEFARAGIDFERRGRLFDEKLAVFRAALSGEPFIHDGRTLTVTPPPQQRPHPFLIVGGRAAKRAARLGDAFLPAVADPELGRRYVDECRRLGRGDGVLLWPGGPRWVFVTDDPERSWAELGPHVLHEAADYARMGRNVPGANPWGPVETVADIRASGGYAVVTPEECRVLAAGLDRRSALTVKPLVAGLDPAVGWRSLELFADEVAPYLA